MSDEQEEGLDPTEDEELVEVLDEEQEIAEEAEEAIDLGEFTLSIEELVEDVEQPEPVAVEVVHRIEKPVVLPDFPDTKEGNKARYRALEEILRHKE